MKREINILKKCNCSDECNCTPEDNCGRIDECCCDDNCNCNEDKSSCDCDIEHNSDEEQILILKNNIEHLNEKIKQTQAELINYRKRKDDEVSNMLNSKNPEEIINQMNNKKPKD